MSSSTSSLSSPDGAGRAPWLAGRALIVGAFAAVTILLSVVAGVAPVRIALISAASVVLVVYAFVGARRVSRDPLLMQETRQQFVVAFACNVVIVTVTGGLESPLIPNLAGPAIALVAVARSRRGLLLVGAACLLVVLAWAAAPAAWMMVDWARPYRLALTACATMVLVVHLGRVVLMLGARLIATTQTLDDVRESMLEDAAERSRALEAIGAKVAHELRNPLAAIKSLLHVERDLGTRDARSEKRFDVMTGEIARMESILRDYLSFSRPLENLTLAPVDLAALADNVVAVLEGRGRAAGVQLVRTGANVVLSADGRRLKEALLNLAANALEATPKGGRVELKVERAAEGGRVSVRDTGVGMSPSVLERLGTPFFTTREAGTGLGVVLARTVVKQHGGDLQFTSRPGDGTTAVMTIPFDVEPQGAPFGEGPSR